MFNNFVKSMMALCMVTSGWTTNSFESTYRLTQSKIDDFFSNGSKKNDEIKDRTSDENSEINTSNSSEGSIEEDGIKKERNENSSVQYGVINIISDSSDINASHSSDGSIEKVDVETQMDEEGAVDSSDLNSSNSAGWAIKSVDAETKIVEKDVERNNTEERCYIDLLHGESSVPSEKATIRPGSYCRRTDPVNSLISFVKKGNQVSSERLNNTLYDVSDADQSNKLLGLLKDQIDETNIVSLLGGLLYVTRQFGSSAITEQIKKILLNKCTEYGIRPETLTEEVKACLKEDLGSGGEVDDDTVKYFTILSEICTRTYPEQ